VLASICIVLASIYIVLASIYIELASIYIVLASIYIVLLLVKKTYKCILPIFLHHLSDSLNNKPILDFQTSVTCVSSPVDFLGNSLLTNTQRS